LADSLPARVKEEIAKVPPADRIQTVDASLDQGYGRRDLEIPEIAKLVQDALLHLIETRTGYTLDRVVHAWKSYTAKQANYYLKRSGAFWAPEYFDRYIRDEGHFYIRDEGHFAATRAYIQSNPVAVGLCRQVSDWRFSSARLV
jgi:putative DNA methylase